MKCKMGILAIAVLFFGFWGTNNTAAQEEEEKEEEADKIVTSVKETDVQFLDMMMPHHADGVKLAQTGIEKAQNADVKALAEKMAAGQQKDIDEMQKMRESRFPRQPKAEMMTVKGRKMTLEIMTKMSREDMQRLEAANKAEFDRAFLEIFIKHHQTAIDMSREETSKGKDAGVKKKAREIIAVQTKEMAQMRRLKTQLAQRQKAEKYDPASIFNRQRAQNYDFSGSRENFFFQNR